MWGWKLSSLLYARAGEKVSKEFDLQLIGILGPKLEGAVIADCGCGPGVTAGRLVDAGAGKVIAIDAVENMLRQVPRHPRIVRVQATIEEGTLRRVGKNVIPDGADLVLFKRSLYHRGEQAVRILQDAWELLRPGGRIVVALPHRNIARYAFGRPRRIRSFTLYHLFNRFISRVADFLNIHSYRTSSFRELASMLRRAVPEAQPRPLLPPRLPFAVLSVQRPADATRDGAQAKAAGKPKEGATSGAPAHGGAARRKPASPESGAPSGSGPPESTSLSGQDSDA